MSWAEVHGLRSPQTNPCFGLQRYRENERQRYLSLEEIARLGAVLDGVAARGGENVYIAAALRLLLLTGARLGELLSLKWTNLDLERRLLILAGSKTGHKIIRLNPEAVRILRDLGKISDNPHVIAGRRDGAGLVNLQKPWRRIRKEAQLDDVRLHDLRHRFASVAAASKGSLPMIGRLLGHTNSRTTARYAHLADDSADDLNAKVGAAIACALTRKTETANNP
jgi:integrase